MANEKPVLYPIDSYGENEVFGGRGFASVGHDGTFGSAKGALRFENVPLSNSQSLNMCILKYIYGTYVGSGTGSWKFKVYGIDEDNTADFSSSPFGRTKTSASLTINEGPPTAGGSKELDVSSIVSEIISRAGWSSGNAIGFLLENDGSDNDVYADIDDEDSYLVFRLVAQPDFTPTPIIVSAPTIPSPGNYGLRISQPGINVLTATISQLYYTSGKKRFKIKTEGQVTTNANPHIIAHGLSYIPFVEVFAKSGAEWFRLPFRNFSGGSNVGYVEINDTNVVIYVGVGTVIYYYVFLDELAT